MVEITPRARKVTGKTRAFRLKVCRVPCPECGAAAFERCHRKNGENRRANHLARVKKAKAEGHMNDTVDYGSAVCPQCFKPILASEEYRIEHGCKVHRTCTRRVPVMIGFDPVTKEPRAIAALSGDKSQDAIFVSDCEIKGLKVELKLHGPKMTERVLKKMGL